jgi:nuclear pore complex protein Nup155
MRGAPGWASEALVDGGVGLRDMWDAAFEYYEAVSRGAYAAVRRGTVRD